jgi:hypothetical protein
VAAIESLLSVHHKPLVVRRGKRRGASCSPPMLSRLLPWEVLDPRASNETYDRRKVSAFPVRRNSLWTQIKLAVFFGCITVDLSRLRTGSPAIIRL